MSLIDGIAFLLFLLPVPGWSATLILLAAALRKPRIPALSERALAAVILSGAASLAAYLGSLRLTRTTVDPDIAVIILATICLAVSIPSLIWLVRFLRGDFGTAE